MSRDPDNLCAQRLKVLGEETRLKVVRALMSGSKCVSEINADLDIDQSLLSHHLQVLRDAGLVVSERRGKSVEYSLSPKVKRKGDAIDLECCALHFQ